MMTDVSPELLWAVEGLQGDARLLVGDPNLGGIQIIRGIPQLLLANLRSNDIDFGVKVADEEGGIQALFVAEALDQLVRNLLAMPGGKGKYEYRRSAVVNTIHALLVSTTIEQPGGGNLLIYTNVFPRLVKGAAEIPLAQGRSTSDILGLKLYGDLRLLPPDGLLPIIVFLVDKSNWRSK